LPTICVTGSMPDKQKGIDSSIHLGSFPCATQRVEMVATNI
jgi:hypothetical protein